MKTNRALKAFAADVISKLDQGKNYKIPGFGTFSSCARKATQERQACRIAMFRAAVELRDFTTGGKAPSIDGVNMEAIQGILDALHKHQSIDIPLLGRLAVVKESGKKSKLIFHGEETLNRRLSESC